ncbi:MAG: CPBP family intramembrane glutamic endopeptidase [Solirubrobacteraceae bacterium]|jgi:membrane protease YdiL (CAAX protease family)
MVNGAASESNGWNPWFAPLALIVSVVAETIVGVVVLVVGLGGHVTQAQANNPPPAVTDVSTALGEICFVLVALWLAAWGTGRPIPAQFGLRRPNISLARAAAAVIVGYLAFLLLSALWTDLIKTGASEKYLVKDVGAHSGIAGVLASCLVLCVIAPFCEEFLFRGFIFGALRNWRGPLVATLITGILFGAVHAGSAPAVDLVPLGVLGMILCGLRQLTGSIYPGIALHAFNNVVALVVNAGWSFAAFCAVLVGSFAMIVALVALGQRSMRLRLV